MATAHRLGKLRHITCDALGEPGRRRFRLHLMSEQNGSALLWVEKQQLIALAEAIESVLSGQEYRHVGLALNDEEPPPPVPLSPTIEMDVRAGEFSLGLNAENGQIVVMAAEPADEEQQTVAGEFAFRQGYGLQQEIATLVAAGRPPCPLCHAPLDSEGHVCPRRNGHHKDV